MDKLVSKFCLGLKKIEGQITNKYLIPKLLHKKYSMQEGKILRGPFKGMKYDIEKNHGSAWRPKLLGVYEHELHPILNTIFKERMHHYSKIIDIGTAEGYYLNGFALTSKKKGYQTELIGFESEEERINECIRLNKVNDLNNIRVLGECTKEKMLSTINENDQGLIFCDCEGFEHELFTPNLISEITGFDLLIELHELDSNSNEAFNVFIERLSKDYEIEIIPIRNYRVKSEMLDLNVPAVLTYNLLDEGRMNSVGWIFAKSNKF